MKKNVIQIVLIAFISVLLLYSCYNNKEDITVLPTISFLGDVVPIVTSGGCGCHNNVQSNTANNNAVPFTHYDTIKDGTTIVKVIKVVDYGAIIARIDTMRQWAEGKINHPGGGAVTLTENQKEIIKAWVAQGPPYDGGSEACVIPGKMTYTNDINPIYNVTCKSAGCHGGRGPILTYSLLVNNKTTLTNMMNSAGSSGHPGGKIGLSSCTVNKFKAWIAAGQPN